MNYSEMFLNGFFPFCQQRGSVRPPPPPPPLQLLQLPLEGTRNPPMIHASSGPIVIAMSCGGTVSPRVMQMSW